jgi:hypothetical protein
MKKVCNGGFTDLVLEVLKNTSPIANTPPTPPKQLLDLIFYKSSLVGLPTLTHPQASWWIHCKSKGESNERKRSWGAFPGL